MASVSRTPFDSMQKATQVEVDAAEALHKVDNLPYSAWDKLLGKKISWKYSIEAAGSVENRVNGLLEDIKFEFGWEDRHPAMTENASWYHKSLGKILTTLRKENDNLRQAHNEISGLQKKLSEEVHAVHMGLPVSDAAKRVVCSDFREKKVAWTSACTIAEAYRSSFRTAAQQAINNCEQRQRGLEHLIAQANAQAQAAQAAQAAAAASAAAVASSSSSSSSAGNVSVKKVSIVEVNRETASSSSSSSSAKKRVQEGNGSGNEARDESRPVKKARIAENGMSSSSSSSSVGRTSIVYPREIDLEHQLVSALPGDFPHILRDLVRGYVFDPAPEIQRLEAIRKCQDELAAIQKEMEANKWEDCNGIISGLSQREAAKKAELYDLEHPEEATARREQEERERVANISKYYRAERTERRFALVGGGEQIETNWNFYRLNPGEAGMDLRQLPENIATRLRGLDQVAKTRQALEQQQKAMAETRQAFEQQQKAAKEQLEQAQKRVADLQAKMGKKAN